MMKFAGELQATRNTVVHRAYVVCDAGDCDTIDGYHGDGNMSSEMLVFACECGRLARARREFFSDEKFFFLLIFSANGIRFVFVFYFLFCVGALRLSASSIRAAASGVCLPYAVCVIKFQPSLDKDEEKCVSAHHVNSVQ